MATEPHVRDRVQIVPLGFECARLREPIRHWKADVVVAIEYSAGDREIPYLTALLDELAGDERIELDRRECDLFDLYDALGAIIAAITDYESDDVTVNLSAGSKITAIAGMLACMATGASPIYARPDYGPDGERIPDEPLHDEVATMFELPTYPIERPSDQHLSVMAYIDEESDDAVHGRYRGVSKKDLIAFVRERAFAFVAQSEASTQKGYYRLLDRHVIDPLTAKGYLATERVGRQKFVSLTPQGENALRAFRHFIDV